MIINYCRALICFLIIIFFQSNELFAQEKLELKPSNNHKQVLISLSLAASPLERLNYQRLQDYIIKPNFLTIPGGFLLSYRYNNRISPGITIGLLYDFKPYEMSGYDSYLSDSIMHTYRFHSKYNLLYIPVNFNLYFNRFCASIGYNIRRAVNIKHQIDNNYRKKDVESSGGMFLGISYSFPLNKKDLSLQIEPFISSSGGKNDSFSHFSYSESTELSGHFWGVNFKLTQRIFKLPGKLKADE